MVLYWLFIYNFYAIGTFYKFFFTEIVNKPWVDAVKYAALYPKMKVEPAKIVFFLVFLIKIICKKQNNEDQ